MNLNNIQVYNVADVNQYIKGLMDHDALLAALAVRGEISNYKLYPSGHHYFSLKDESGAIRCVMFRSDGARLRFRPQNGMKVVALGRVTVFPRDGQYQLYCRDLVPDGVGALHQAFEQLRDRLGREGLFDPGRKRPLPPYPTRVVLVTSPAGAAVRDLLRVLGARWPMASVLLIPVRVQGEGAWEEIARAIRWAGRTRAGDLIITGRGGGSMEDLWAFNEEGVARAIAHCPIPVISAVGHEPDVTIADYVADLRAATPSNGAELAVPDQVEVRAALENLSGRMVQALRSRLERERRQVKRLRESRVLVDPMAPIQDRRMLLDYHQRGLTAAARGGLWERKEKMAALAAALDALSPLKVLGRGYSMVLRDKQVVVSVDQVSPGDPITVTMGDGTLACVVEKRRKKHGRKKADL